MQEVLDMMYKVDVKTKRPKKLKPVNFSDLEIRERFDIEVWVRKNPEILGESLLIISEQTNLPSGRQPDLLALDKNGNLVVIELKKDDSGKDVYWQAITYAANFSELSYEEILGLYKNYLRSSKSEDRAEDYVANFIEEDLEKINQNQRIILVSKEFHPDVLKAVLWLRDFEIDIKCIRLKPFVDEDTDQLFIIPETIIPTPGVEDYIENKIRKARSSKRTHSKIFSLEKGNFSDEELKRRLKETLTRESNITPRLIEFIKILLSEERAFSREEIKQKLFEQGIGKNLGKTGTYLSNISHFLTLPSTSHLRQIIEFDTPHGKEGETKDNYRIVDKYRKLVREVLEELGEI